LTTRRHHTKILSSGNNLKQLSIAPPDVAGQRNVKGHSGREEEDKGRQAPNGRAKEFSSNPCQYLEYIFSSVISGIIHRSIQEIEEIGGKTFGRLQRARSSIQYTDQGQDTVKMSQTRIRTTTLQACFCVDSQRLEFRRATEEPLHAYMLSGVEVLKRPIMLMALALSRRLAKLLRSLTVAFQ